ncbi:MAG: PKD domain-containing protein [Sphingobacteriales bacterium]|nr:MAG: PKD domain-containing protein [Sphingobacteriales bacterium]
MYKQSTIFVLLFLIFVCLPAKAQVSAGGTPYSIAHPEIVGAAIPVITLPAVDIEALILEDMVNDAKNQPFRFGAEIKTMIGLDNSGIWETLPNGDRLWRVSVYSKKAKTLNFVFSSFYMPPGAKLHLYNGSKSEIIGAFTSSNNKSHGLFSTGLIRGDLTTFEYYEPAQVSGQGRLSISKAVHGYRGFFSPEKGFGDSGSCNNNVNCPEAADWQDQKRSVALIISGGFRACTGAMVNNVNNDCTPYFLTANHCLDSSVSTWVFMFNYESPDCTNIDGPLNQTASGCTLMASASASDFALVLLSEVPPIDYNIYYSGWSAESTPGTSSVGIHHPAGDIKKITFNEDVLVSSEGLSGVTDSHWEVTEWEDGTTEGGSSGSPLFDQNKRIVGQLHGGTASCNSLTYDAYGKVAYSWSTGTTATTRLRDWLDPVNTGILAIDGRNCSEPLYSLDAGITQLTAPPPFLCNVSEIVPQILVRNYGSTTLTSFTVVWQLDGGLVQTFEWTGSLEFLAPAYISLPTILVPDGEHSLWVSVVQPNGSATDENILNDSVFFNFTTTSGSNVSVSLVCDYWADETSFTITNQQGEVLYNQSGFSSFQNFNQNFCLPADCYTFTILDSYCDGMDPGASYQVILPDGSIIAEGGGNFGCSESYDFCMESPAFQASIANLPMQSCPLPAVVQFVGGPSTATTFSWQFEGGNPSSSEEANPIVLYEEPGSYAVTLIVSNGVDTDTLTYPDYITIFPELELTGSIITPAFSPNSTDGAISISLSGGVQPYTYIWSNNATTPEISGLSPGQYCVTVTAGINCSLTDCFTVPVVVNTEPEAIPLQYQVSIYPNPVSHSAQIRLEIPQTGNYNLLFFDLIGRCLDNSLYKLALSEGITTIPLNIQNLPGGFYFAGLQTTDGQLLNTTRWVVLE